MTDQQHPITPPPELRQLWAQQAQRKNPRDPVAWQEHVANQAAQWGADQELEACCDYMQQEDFHGFAKELRAARRPKPPSLKEQALAALATADGADQPVVCTVLTADQHAIIRRALESLPS